ncbi:Fe-S cluster assembly ATPase SufC [Candidatus Gracilibacteria bacterium]|nr:Fe-S cluster assembly ATPase SufC [Candidatus Gracilibacteria bacterium]
MHTLQITNLHARVDDKEILKGLTLTVKSGEIHAIMGKNGSGKSTLCKVLMGHPAYEVTAGTATLDGKDILELDPNERANLGLFLGFQHPLEIPGVTLGNFLRIAKNANRKANDEEQISPREFLNEIKEKADQLKVDQSFINRSVNEGFSGGERKRAEIVQMAVLEPKIALLDEIDSGLDIDALKIVAEGINKTHAAHKTGILLITHYQRILNYITPDFVHVMNDGKIIKSGGSELAHKLEAEGYEQFIN